MILFLLSACNILNPEKAGIYGCDEYCNQLIAKAQTCADEEGVTLGEFAAAANPDWQDKGEEEILTSCDEQLVESAKSETECKAETGTFNNLGCDDILSLIGKL